VTSSRTARCSASLIDEYYFEWDGDGAIALGLGSLYNHSDTPVAEYIKDTVNDVLVVRALSAIATGEEITFSYSGPAHPEVGPDSGT
jgi:SET domain-containing protein